MEARWLPADLIDDGPELEVVEKFDVVHGLLPQLVALLVAEHIAEGLVVALALLLRAVHLEQVLHFGVAEGARRLRQVVLVLHHR